MTTNQLADYEFLWTTEKSDYALFTINAYGRVEYLVYHIPTKRVKTMRCDLLGQRIVEMMIARGVPVLDDMPAFAAHQAQPAAH